jgi:hypothetical protein
MNNPDTPVNPPEPGSQEPGNTGKLVLSAPVTEYRPVADEQKTVARPMPPLPRSRPLTVKRDVAPRQPLARMAYYWHKDPAYKVFIVATCMVLIAGIVFVSLATAAVIRNPNLFSTGTGGSVSQSGPTPSNTVDFRPSFPTPGGGVGSTQSSQPPMTSTPVLAPTSDTTPTTTPTTPPNEGTLTAQITSIPSQVFNGQMVQVLVNTSVPGASVRLEASYNAPPYFYVSGTQQADGNGNVVLYWRVGVGGIGHGYVMARVVALAVANGQRATSQQVTVQVTTVGIGG